MYPYSDLPPNQNPNNQGQGNYPPYNYPPNPYGQGGYPPNQNPNNQGGYPQYNYQNVPPGNYYPPQPPRPFAYPMLRAFGIVMLVLFMLTLIGHHGFFFWPLIIVGIVLVANRRHCFGGYGHYRHHNHWQNRYNQPNYYDYSQVPQQPAPGYNYPPQSPRPQQGPTANPGWPAPGEESKTENPY